MKEFWFGKNTNKVRFIVKTAILTALTIAVQYLSGLLSQQLLTGSIVNLMLLINTMYIGLVGSMFVGLVTPWIGFLVGLSSNIVLVPFISVSNLLFVLVFKVLEKILRVSYKERSFKSVLFIIISFVVAALVKFSFLYFLALKLILPLLLPKIPPQLNVMFGVTQLFTALIGGTVFTIYSKVFKLIEKEQD